MMPKPVLWHHKDDSSETQGTSIDSVSIYRIHCKKKLENKIIGYFDYRNLFSLYEQMFRNL